MNNSEKEKIEFNVDKGVMVARGFMGNDKRPLAEIIENDRRVLSRYNLTCSKIASALTRLKKEGETGIGNNVIVDKIFEVNVDISRGFIRCPFDPRNHFRKTNISVRKLRTNENIFFSELSIHLIEKHCFFQGKGSPYRLEPTKLIKFLEEFFENEKKSEN
ncbi:MAG: hypothetical protein ACP5D6_00805 [Kosmotogaceae bacterium]